MTKTIQTVNLDFEIVRSQLKQYFQGMTKDQLDFVSMDIDEIQRGKLYSDEFFEKHTTTPMILHKPSRQEVVNNAKQKIERLENRVVKVFGINEVYNCKSVFIVNKEKRTVVSLLKNPLTGEIIKRGIAKCLPEDCFNAHIGKAIAFYRALNRDIPNEYLNAPAPEGKEVGDVVNYWNRFMNKYENKTLVSSDNLVGKYTAHTKSVASKTGRVIDDSDRKY
ncbi:hypothetical protein GCM10008931_43540 [Oceanobacillus oncorhynchi subsp. oncorhynchi]|uniref:hypothetical protein n=1 Tax=Oceanobacillus oncorhynchi TaxID=545501 RepID=UPI0031DFA2FE